MYCLNCGYSESKVIDSRDLSQGVRRRRECLHCRSRFTTYERVQRANLFVLKKDGRREEFNRDKLLTGIRKACQKRPLPTGMIDKMVDDIEAELYRQGRAEVPSPVIGDIVIERLRNMDHIAYLRFASVYREFADITALKEEVDTLLKGQIGEAITASQLPLLPQKGWNKSTAAKRPARLKEK